MKYGVSVPTHAEVIGQFLIDYFETEGFPMELLQNPTLNSLYLRNELKKTLDQRSLSLEERYVRMKSAFERYYNRAGIPDPGLYIECKKTGAGAHSVRPYKLEPAKIDFPEFLPAQRPR